MKLIIRADDVGYSVVHNMGSFKCIDDGVVTSADVMLDCPGTVDALEKLRERPWISTGWHAHFWGTPVLDPKDVPTLYDPERKGFRKDLPRLYDVDYDEALAECRAEMDLCVKILGRALDTCGMNYGDTPMGKAMDQVIKEYGIVSRYLTDFFSKESRPADSRFPEIHTVTGTPVFQILRTDSIKGIAEYDPIKYYLEDQGGRLAMGKDEIAMDYWHPGYVDYFVYKQGDYGDLALNYIAIRTEDVHALCSDEVKGWIRDNGIELINLRDALYGIREYQNHLRAIGSDLAV